MNEEFYAVIKLVSGEEIFSLVSYDENSDDPLLILQSPVIIKIVTGTSGKSTHSYIKIKPWMELPNEDLFIIKLDKVITMTEVKDSNLILCYKKYHQDSEFDDDMLDSDDGRVKISDKMGYISSVTEARIRLENLYKKD
jgi:hypothetical protein